MADGVPEMTPAGEMDMPAGKAGVTDHDVTEPPVLDIVTAEMAVPLVPVMVLAEAAKTGTWCCTVNWYDVDDVPPELVAVMVYVVAANATVGVPVMPPLAKSNPFGRSGEMVQVATSPPVLVVVLSVMA